MRQFHYCNIFITFNISPTVTASAEQLATACGPIDLLSTRRLDTGNVRVRDGHTLILTGVLNSTDKETVTKVPIFGDMPLIGPLFRSTTSQKEKRELVILVTPQILKGSDGSIAGNYSPSSPEAKKLLDP